MTDATYKLELILPDELMIRFGTYVAQVCVQFPAHVAENLDRLLTAADDPKIELAAFRATLQRLRDMTVSAANLGEAVANIIGTTEPVRIDGGPVQ